MLSNLALHFCCICLIRYGQAEIFAIKFNSQFSYREFEDVAATFGGKLSDGVVRGMLLAADPPDGCDKSLKPPPPFDPNNDTGNWVVIMPRSSEKRNCSFEQKVRIAQSAGYDAVIVHNVHSNQLVPMSAKNATGIYIPAVFVSEMSGNILIAEYANNSDYYLVITGQSPFNIQTHLLIPFAIVVGICFIVLIVFMVVKFIKDRRRQRRHRMPTSTLNKIPTCKFQKGDPYETCAICLDDYIEGEKLRVLPCNHAYHSKCIDPWLTKNRRVCPICKRKVFAHNELPQHHDSDSDSDTADDTTPLINSSNRGGGGGTFQEQSENPFQRAVRSVSQPSRDVNFVTVSDNHSINGEFQSCDSTSSAGSDTGIVCDQVDVHTRLDISSSYSSTSSGSSGSNNIDVRV